MTTAPDLPALLGDAIADPATHWSLGTFGAVAEFLRDPDEAAALDRRADGTASVSTARGALRVTPAADVRPVPYETAFTAGWNHAVALCLPAAACAASGRTVVRELGPDADAVDPADRDAVLFDLGLGVAQADVCVRTRDPATLAALRAAAGRPLLDPGNPLWPALPDLGPERVFLCRFGRIEVKQPIPPPGGRSPEGPHTHVLPKLLKSGRTHAATATIPEGWVPCMHLFPPHPLKDALGRPTPFDAARHAAFRALWERYADPGLVATKRRVRAALAAGRPAESVGPLDRAGRMVARVAALQAAAEAGEPLPTDAEGPCA